MEALILSCGGSHEPLQYCIKNYTQDFVYFLCSKDTVDIAEEIIKQENINEDKYKVKIVSNHESLDDCYAKSREIIEELQKDFENIHVDFTGGTKPMVAGLVLASIGEKCLYTYVGSKNPESRDKEGRGIVLDGFEKIKEQKDPYEVYAVMEFNRGMDFFNKYQFSAAKSNFIEASKKLESRSLKEIAELFVDIVDVYDSWDKFNNLYNNQPIKTAFYNIDYQIENSGNLKQYFNENQPLFFKQLKNNWNFLELKVARKGLIEPDNVKYYLPDLLNNAYRRIEEGKFDDAVARLYRAIELIAQLGLTNEGIIKTNVLMQNKEFKIDLNIIEGIEDEKIRSFIYQLKEYEIALRRGKTHIGIGSSQSYELLSKFGVDYAKDYLADKKLKSNVGSRNGSILAHGLHPIDEKMAMKLYGQVLTYSKRAFPEIVKYMDMADFPKFE